MSIKIKQLSKHTLIYGLGSTASKAITFFLVPLYTAYLIPSDFGVLQICRLLNAVLTIVLILGMSSSMFRVYYNVDTSKDKQIIINSTFVTFTIFSIIVLVPLFLFSSELSKFLVGSNRSQYVFNILLISIFLESFFSLQLAILRAEERAKLYAFINLIRIIIYTIFSVILIAFIKMNYIGSIQAGLYSFIIVVLILIPITLKKFSLNISFVYIKEILQIGIPLAIGGLGLWVLNLSDRYMIKFILPENLAMTEVGLYSLGDRIASLVRFVIISPFMIAWGALMYQFAKESNAQELFARVFRYFVVIVSLLGMFLSIFSKEIIDIISMNNEYNIAYKVVPILAFSKIFSGLIIVISVGVIITKKAIFVSVVNISAAILNILLNLVLIKQIGMLGAAIASLTSYIYAFYLLHHYSVKYYPINWNLQRNILFIFIIFILSILSVYSGISFFYKIFLFLIAILIIHLLKMLEIKELFSFFNMFKKRL